MTNQYFTESLAIHSPDSLVSSRNQQIHVFNPMLEDQLSWSGDQIEVHILNGGTQFTGYRRLSELTETTEY